MKTAYKLLIGAAAAAVAYVSYNTFSNTRVIVCTPEELDVAVNAANYDPDAVPPSDDAETVVEETVIATEETVVTGTVEVQVIDTVSDAVQAAVNEIDLMYTVNRDFKELVDLVERGGAVMKDNLAIAVSTDPSKGTVELQLTKFHVKGNPIGNIRLFGDSKGIRYRTDGAYGRGRGDDPERILELLLIFHFAIE